MAVRKVTLDPDTPADFVYGLWFEISHSQFREMHTHDFCEFCIVTSGQMKQKCNNSQFEQSAKQLCFIRSTDVHTSACYDCDSVVYYNIGIPMKILHSACKLYGISIKDLYAPDMPIVVTLHKREYESLINKIRQFEKSDYGVIHGRRFINLLADFLLYITSSSDSRVQVQYSPDTPEFMKELLSNMNDPDYFTVGLSQLLSLTPYSHEYISRCFRKYLKCTPTEYINMLRVGYAKKLITEERVAVSDACVKCGFKSESYFYSQFKKYYMCSPKELLKKYKNMSIS